MKYRTYNFTDADHKNRKRAAGKPEKLGDGPVEQQYEGKMRFLAQQIDHLFNGEQRGEDRTTGFVLMVFEFGDHGRANYMSNASRADVVNMLKEQIARFEGQPEQKGTA